MPLKITKEEGLWLVNSTDEPDIVGSGLSPEMAEQDYYERLAHGWSESRKTRLIRAIRRGLTARSVTDTTDVGKAELRADTLDLEEFITMIQNDEYIVVTGLRSATNG